MAARAVLLQPGRLVCPNCPTVAPARPVGGLRPGSGAGQFHRCAGLAGFLAPLVPEGAKVHVVAVERGDYIGGEKVRTDANGRPIMAVRTLRNDGYDTAVFAPVAQAHHVKELLR